MKQAPVVLAGSCACANPINMAATKSERLKRDGWITWASAPMLSALPQDGDGPFISLTEAHHNLAIVLQPPVGGANYLNSPGRSENFSASA